MIALEAVATHRAPLALGRITLSWKAGVHSLVGAPSDGGPLLLDVVAGRERLRSGRVAVLEGAPVDAGVRPRVAYVPREPALPEAMRVRDVLALAAALRGEPASDPVARLGALGVETLAPRRVKTLAPEEARAVALVEALTSSAVRVVLIDEPLVGLDPRAAPHVPARLRERGRDGCAVLVATASVRDAGEIADDHVLLRSGAVVGRATSFAELASSSPSGVRVRVVSNDPAALLAAIASEESVEAVARRDAAVIARGRDAVTLAAAVGRAVTISGVDVVELSIEPPTLDEARAAAATAKPALDPTNVRPASMRPVAPPPPEPTP
jgi:ABC-2 type transport system ATP-binding protein